MMERYVFVFGREDLSDQVCTYIYPAFLSVVANELVRIQRDFLWGWGADERKIA